MHHKARIAGFSLIELIVVIAVVGILSGIVAVFIRSPMEGYMAASRRAELSDSAEGAMLRIARDVRTALPNSVRVVSASGTVGSCSGTEACYLEYLPIEDGGRYRAETDSAGAGDTLNFADAADGSFDVLGPPVTANRSQFLVIYNLGLDSDTDAWQGGNRRAVTSSGTVSNLVFSPATQFPLESPNSRFYLVGTPISYVCNPVDRTLRRYSGYGAPTAAQPTSFGTATGNRLATHVKRCNMTYEPGARQRLGQLTLWLQLEDSEGDNVEQVSLYREVVVNNDA